MIIFDVKSVDVALLQLLVIVNGVASYPQASVTNLRNSHVDIPGDGDYQGGTNSDNNQQPDDAIKGSIEINDENIKGHVDIPDDSDYQGGMHSDNNQQPDDAIKGSIEINDENIKGHVDIPDDSDYQGGMHSDNNQQPDDAIKGSIEINDENIKGHLDIPNDSDYQGGMHSDNNQQQDDAIKRSIEINDENIAGHVEIPGDGDNQDGMHSDNKQQPDDAIKGSIEINDENIKGHVDIPGDSNYQGGMHSDNNQQPDDAIKGSIEINDENITGHVDIPGDGDNQDGMHSDSIQQQDDAIKGSIEINDEYIKGHVDIPDDGDYQGGMHSDNIQLPDDAIKGSIEINDENIKGHVDIPDDGDYQGGMHSDNIQLPDDAIKGSIEINDENIKGHVDIPSGNDIQTVPGDLPSDQDSRNAPKGENDLIGKGSDMPLTIGENCWMDLKSQLYLDALKNLDATYRKARQQYHNDVGTGFDKKLMEVLLYSQGKAPRSIHQAQGDPSQIPAGINLGGYCMMRMTGSLLFFHRMKLRNSTQFRVNSLKTSLIDMTLTAHLSLNDLHLRGAYERSRTGQDPTELYYVPTFGELDVLLKNVSYKMEGRLRLLNNRLLIELVNSDLLPNEMLLTYDNDSVSMKLEPRNLEDYLGRLKTDLDSWMKDFFNDYLMYFGTFGEDKDAKILTYEKQKTVKANAYADYVIKAIKERLRNLGAADVQLPSFKIHSINNAKIKLKSGLLRGLDSIYRRSVATTKTKKRIRQLDFIISFSKLKVEYQYEAMLHPGLPTLSGMLMLSADELTAHVELSQLMSSETIDLNLDSVTPTKSESLIVEGPANRMIADYKHILQHPITAIMLNIMKHNIKMLSSLTRCEPYLQGNNKNRAKNESAVQPNTIPEDNAENRIDGEPGDGGYKSVPVDSLITYL